MRTLKDLKLRKKTHEKVELWLQEWINHFIKLADGRVGNVYRADFEKMDLFFFTECNDLITKDIESTGDEKNMEIRRRKRMVVLQLLLKTLKGEKLGRKIKCSHCGYDDVYIGSRPSGGGHYHFCKKCGKTDVCTYPNFYDTTMQELKQELFKQGLLKPDSFNEVERLIKEVDSEKRTCTECGKKASSDEFTISSGTCNECYTKSSCE